MTVPDSKRYEVRVGIVTILAIGILIAGIIWAREDGLGAGQSSLIVLFDDAAGIVDGTPLYFHGVQVGSVTGLDIVGDRAVVSARIQSDLELRRGTEATLKLLELTGAKRIDLIQGDGTQLLDFRDTIRGVNQADLGSMVGDMADLLSQLGPVLERTDSTLAVINSIAGEAQFKSNVTSAVRDFAASARSLRGMLRENRSDLNSAVRTIADLARESRQFLKENEAALSGTIEMSRSTMSQAQALIKRSDNAVSDLARLTRRIDTIAIDVREGDGTLSRLLYDDSMINQLDSTLTTLRVILKGINRRGINVNVELGHENE